MAKLLPLLNLNENRETKAEPTNENVFLDLFQQVYQMWTDTSHYVDANGTSDLTKGEYFRIGVAATFGQLAWLIPAIKGMKGTGAKTNILKTLVRAGSKLKQIVGLAKSFKSAKTVDDAKAAVVAAGGNAEKFEKEAGGGKDTSESLKFYNTDDVVNENEGGTRITRTTAKKKDEKAEPTNESLVDLFHTVVQMWTDTSHYVDANGTSDLTKGEYFRIGVAATFGQLAWLIPAIKGMKGTGAKTNILTGLSKFAGKIKQIVSLARAFKSADSVDAATKAVATAGGDVAKFKEETGGKDSSESLKFYESTDVNEEEDKKEYVVVGDNNFWYATITCNPSKLGEEIEDIKRGMKEKEYDNNDATELSCYETTSMKTFKVEE